MSPMFLVRFNRVTTRWPKIAPIDLERMAYYCDDLTDFEMSKLCNLLLDNCEYVPSVAKVVEYSKMVKNHRQGLVNDIQNTPYTPNCGFCGDLGVVQVKSHDGEIDSLMLCNCNDMQDSRAPRNKWALPKWNESLHAKEFKHRRCPMDWFKPESATLGAIQDKAAGWRERIKIAEQFWAQNNNSGGAA